MRNCGATKNVVRRCSCRFAVYHTKNSNHLEQNTGITWHKRSMLVNDGNAECGLWNIMFLKKKETIYDGAIGTKETF